MSSSTASDGIVEEVAGTAPALRPRAHIVTLYGLYARQAGGWMSVSALVRLMGRVGIEEPAVRSSISRLKQRGILEARREGGRAGYALSERAGQILARGDRRIFERPRARLADGWVLVFFSVPESERRRRHQLRSRLSWLGFGTVGPGVWIAPRHLEDEARDMLRHDGLADYVQLFAAEHLGFSDVADQVRQWWDLDALAGLYRDFERAHAPVVAAWSRPVRRAEDGEAFADYLRTLTHWRRLPFLDPGLAPELLPRDWAGVRATATYHALDKRLKVPAARFVDSVRGS